MLAYSPKVNTHLVRTLGNQATVFFVNNDSAIKAIETRIKTEGQLAFVNSCIQGKKEYKKPNLLRTTQEGVDVNWLFDKAKKDETYLRVFLKRYIPEFIIMGLSKDNLKALAHLRVSNKAII
jgi:hypothetical protein